ncbi:DDE domain protein [Brucella grignonensis]|uniref:DDE domain protein n=1 Tax=Brucella grignonensis TaxID=94627 RepID=A0A256F0U6_9HYPH|nr:DDE domain protein [Brucella grignonensis]
MFKDHHFDKSVILLCVRWYPAYNLSLRNLAGLQAVNTILKFNGIGDLIEIRQIKYLNNILEQDHHFIKRIIKPIMAFNAFLSASVTR